VKKFRRQENKIAETKQEALDQGLPYYFGRKCTRDHPTFRRVTDGHCFNCGRERKIKRKEKLALNPVLKEQDLERERIWRKNHIKSNPKMYEDKRFRQKDNQSRYRETNKEKFREYRKGNRWYFNYKRAERHALKLSGTIKGYEEDLKEIYYEAACRREKGEDVVVDHIYPLMGKNSCGLHVPWNMDIIQSSSNSSKSNKEPSSWFGLTDYEIWFILQ